LGKVSFNFMVKVGKAGFEKLKVIVTDKFGRPLTEESANLMADKSLKGVAKTTLEANEEKGSIKVETTNNKGEIIKSDEITREEVREIIEGKEEATADAEKLLASHVNTVEANAATIEDMVKETMEKREMSLGRGEEPHLSR